MKERVKRSLARHGLRVQHLSAQERALLDGYDPTHAPAAECAAYLTPRNPRLQEIESAYRSFSSPVAVHSQWSAELTTDTADLHFFRGDNAYLWQYTRSPTVNRYRFLLHGRYVQSVDELGLLDGVLDEDGAFGCITFDFDSLPTLSRDLLDSVNELSFLNRHGVLSQTRRVLDIGAGYGRLAHRMLAASASVEHYGCIDAIPRSTFLCEFYLRHRGVTDRSSVIALPDMATVKAGEADLAINVHSFSEMTLEAVTGWVEWLAALDVPTLFVVPNERDQLLSRETDGSRRDCSGVLARAGYTLYVSESTIGDPDVRAVLDVNDYFLLYRR